MEKCTKNGCDRDAFIVPMINIPAVGHAIDAHTPAKQYIDLPVCKDHFDEIKKEDFLDDGLKQNLRDMLSAIGKAQPDFDRAWISKLKIDSKEFQDFRQATAKKSDGHQH